MNITATVTMSAKGEIKLPSQIRQALEINEGDQLMITMADQKLVLQKVPTDDDWAKIIKQIPSERIEFDEDGHYDPEKHPEFHDWMVNG